MTTAPKLIREQLLALADEIHHRVATHAALHKWEAQLRSLAAEPVALNEDDYADIPSLPCFDPQPDSAEGDAYEKLIIAPLDKELSANLRATDEGKGVASTLREANIVVSNGTPIHDTQGEQPKAEGVEIEWPYIFTNTGGMEYVPRHHAERRIAALSAAPQAEQPARDGVRIGYVSQRSINDALKYNDVPILARHSGDENSIPVYAHAPPQQADAEIQPVQCPQCLHAFAIPSITQQADGGAVAEACKIGDYGALDKREWATVIYGDMKIAECYTNEDAEFVAAALNAQPPKSPGVGVDEAMVQRACNAYNNFDSVYVDEEGAHYPAMRAALLAALGGEK